MSFERADSLNWGFLRSESLDPSLLFLHTHPPANFGFRFLGAGQTQTSDGDARGLFGTGTTIYKETLHSF